MPRYIVLLFSVFCLFAVSVPVNAQENSVEGEVSEPLMREGVSIEQAYAFATAQKQKSAAAFFLVSNNTGEHDRLIGASSKVAKVTEIHSMEMDEKGVMEMRKLDGVDIPMGNTIGFVPNGNHIMLIGLESPLKAGEKFTLTLNFEKAGEVKAEIMIKAPYVATSVEKSTDSVSEAAEVPVVDEEKTSAQEPVVKDMSVETVDKTKPVEKKKGLIGKLLGK